MNIWGSSYSEIPIALSGSHSNTMFQGFGASDLCDRTDKERKAAWASRVKDLLAEEEEQAEGQVYGGHGGPDQGPQKAPQEPGEGGVVGSADPPALWQREPPSNLVNKHVNQNHR